MGPILGQVSEFSAQNPAQVTPRVGHQLGSLSARCDQLCADCAAVGKAEPPQTNAYLMLNSGSPNVISLFEGADFFLSLLCSPSERESPKDQAPQKLLSLSFGELSPFAEGARHLTL